MGKVLLLGYFGAGNFGDDALLSAWLSRRQEWLATRGITADIVHSGCDPLENFAESTSYKAVCGEIIEKSSLLGVNPREYDALIAPGGSLLQDVTSIRSLLYYLWVIRRFIAAGKRVFLLNQGIGPLNSWLATFITPRMIKDAALLSLRDKESYNWARRQRGLASHPALLHSCDPVLAADFASPPSLSDFPEEYILALPRPTGDLPYPGDDTGEPEALAALLNTAHRITGLKVLLLPLHPAADFQFCKAVEAAASSAVSTVSNHELVLNRGNQVWTYIARSALVISHRLHGLVAAAAHGIPALGVAYDPKITSFCEDIGYTYCFPATVHHEETAADFKRLLDNYTDIRKEVNAARKEMLLRMETAEAKFDELWD